MENKLEKFTDPRDGKIYKTVKIGDQIWLAENLAFEIPGKECQNLNQWEKSSDCDKWCYYDNEKSKYSKYGIIYQWEAAIEACPEGWHLPSDEEWNELCAFIAEQHGYNKYDDGSWQDVGAHLKSGKRWNDNGNGSNDYGFSAYPGGYRLQNGSFLGFGSYGYWWFSSKENGYNVWTWHLCDYDGDIFRRNYWPSLGRSVRCIKD